MNRIWWIIAFLALAPVLLFAWTGQYSRLISDDDCQVAVAQKLGVWSVVHDLLHTEGGRYGAYLWKAVFAQFDTSAPRITHAIMAALWLVGWYGLVVQGLAFLKIGDSRRALSIAIAALTVAAASNAFYTWESRYWYGAFAVHTLPIVLFTVYMALMVWMAPRLRKNILSLAGMIAGGAICFLIAGFSEAYVVHQLIFLAFCLLMSFALLGPSVRYRYVRVFGVSWLATLVSLIAQLAAPGVAVRTARTISKFEMPDRSLSVVLSKTLSRGFQLLKDPEVFAGFIMLMGVGLLIALVKYKPRAQPKASKPLELTLPVLWLGLIFHLVCMPLLWGSTSGRPYFWGVSTSNDIALNILLILIFLVMIWQRKRINVQLRAREPGRLFLWWFMAAAFIFAALFALTQEATMYFYSSIYLFTSALVFLVVLTSLHSSAEERRFGWLALGSYGLGWVSILAVAFIISFAVGFMNSRVMAAVACLLVFSGLVWGAYLGCLAKRRLPLLQSGQAWIRFLKAGSLVIVLIITASIIASQAALIPDYQNFAKVWDANHQKIIALRDSGEDFFEVSPLPLHNDHYLRGCPGRYYRLGRGAALAISDGSWSSS